VLQIPVIGTLIQKNIMARTSRTLGTLVASGVPILESLTITRETSGNAMFERMYGKVSEAIRDGETISKPMKEHSRPGFHPVTLFFWVAAKNFIQPACIAHIFWSIWIHGKWKIVSISLLIYTMLTCMAIKRYQVCGTVIGNHTTHR